MPVRGNETAAAGRILIGLALAALAAAALFMTVGANGQWDFILAFRGQKLATMVLVAFAIGVSTVLFQTITENRILTPSIMGFDALFILIQTVLVFGIGASRLTAVDPRLAYLGEVGAMILFSGLLYRFLFKGGAKSLHLLMLVGVVCGILFRSLANFLQRIIDPNEFVVLQDRIFASFNAVDTGLLLISAGLIGGVSLLGIRLLPVFDVMTLGRTAAIGLGVDHRRTVAVLLAIIAVLVSVSTALVGPVTFLGLLVASLAHHLVPSARHALILPAAVLLGIILLVGGQVVLEHVFAFSAALSIVIELVGGLAFLVLVIRGTRR